MEAERIVQNCSDKKKIYTHLDNLKMSFINSGYPSILIDKIILPIIQRTELGKVPKVKEKAPPKQFILKLPCIPEKFTRIAKAKVKKFNIDARVVIKSGKQLKSCLTSKPKQNCQCTPCELGIPCKLRNFVYHSTCLHCSQSYVGVSARPDIDKKGRISEYESSIRLPQQHNRTTLGRHKRDEHPNSSNDIKENFTFKVAATGSDALDTFLKEAILIKKLKPQINGKFNNGYII